MAFINQDTQNQDQNPQTASSAPTDPSLNASTGSTMGSIGASTTQTSAPQPKGSGRFTNIQKYISANQGAGDRLATGVGNKVNSQINPELQKTEGNLSNLRDGIQAGQGTLAQGNQINSQVQDKNFDAQAYAADPNNVNTFTNFRTGNAVDETALRKQAADAQAAALQGQQTVTDLGNQFGSESGRQQLLKQTFSPGRNYSTGQQRLDQLFLQQAAPQIQGIQNNITNAGKQFGTYNTQLGTEAGNVDTLANDENTLVNNLNTGIGNRASDLTTAVEGTSGAVNAARIAAQNAANQQFQNLTAGKNISSNFANQLGINSQDRLLNTLKDDGNIDDYLKFGSTTLQGADQLATAQDRAKYDAISKLAGYSPDQRAIKNDTVVQNAVDSTGKLRSDIDARNPDVQNFINTGNTKGNYSYNGNFGGGNATGNYDATVANAKAAGYLDSLSPADLAKLTSVGKFDHDVNDFGQPMARNILGQSLYGNVDNALGQLDMTTATNSTPWSQYNGGQTGINNDLSSAKYNALKNAYQQLANQGYFQHVGIDGENVAPAPVNTVPTPTLPYGK